jgi:hypothetical protein
MKFLKVFPILIYLLLFGKTTLPGGLIVTRSRLSQELQCASASRRLRRFDPASVDIRHVHEADDVRPVYKDCTVPDAVIWLYTNGRSEMSTPELHRGGREGVQLIT